MVLKWLHFYLSSQIQMKVGVQKSLHSSFYPIQYLCETSVGSRGGIVNMQMTLNYTYVPHLKCNGSLDLVSGNCQDMGGKKQAHIQLKYDGMAVDSELY